MKSMRIPLFALVALFAVAGTSAKENYHEKAVNAETKDKFTEVAADVRKEMEDGGRYEYMKVDERKTVDQKLTEMETLFSQNDSVQTMKQDTKIKLFNDQEVVNSILTRRDRDRVICKNEAPIGSHIPVTTCHTYGQEVEAREATHNQLDQWKNDACRGKICASGQP
jgi:hypothetical protein